MTNRTCVLAPLVTFLFVFGSCGNAGITDPNGTAIHSEDSTKYTGGQPVRGDWIRIFQPSDPDALHPLASTHATATYIKESIYQYLCDIHPETLEMVPILAKSLAEVSEDGLEFQYEIREEAYWDNGDPIDGHDCAFTFKAIKNPLSQAPHIRVYYPFVRDVKVDPVNPKKFTVITDSPFFLAETAISGVEIISRKFYDPDDHLGKFSVGDFYELGEELAQDPDIIAFSEKFHNEKYMRDPKFIYGSGPYKIASWTTGDNITLERKEEWWGDHLSDLGYGFHAYADKLIYKTILDRSTAIQAAASGEIDIMRDVNGEEFIRIQEKGGPIKDNFDMQTPSGYSLIYLGMNSRPPSDRIPFFTDKRVRQAINHITPVDKIIENIYGGLGTRATGPILPNQTNEFNPELEPMAYDPEKAKALLDEAGWIDTDGNGLRDKIIRGKRVDFEIDFILSSTSSTGKRIANLLALEAEKVGLKINSSPLDFKVVTTRLRNHQFDIFGTGIVSSPLPTDLKQMWHTDSWLSGGSNYTGFGNAYSDSLINKIRVTIDSDKRRLLYYEFQEIIMDEAPAVFIMNPKEKIIINNRIRGGKATQVRPGYKVNELWVPKDKQKFGKKTKVD